MNTKIFLGSSAEAQKAGLLDELRSKLTRGLNRPRALVEIIPWTESPWENLKGAVGSLVESLGDYSYGIFILSADDKSEIRGGDYHTARDNVIFEFGLFLAHLGPERTFLVGPGDITKTILMSDLAARVASPQFRPLRILSDLGTVYRKGSYSVSVSKSTKKPKIEFRIDEVVHLIKTREMGLATLDPLHALDRKLSIVKSEVARDDKSDSYYSGRLTSHLADISILKARASSKSVRDVIQDTLLQLERIPDICDIEQLAREQHHSRGVRKVWVFSDEPLEFRSNHSGHSSPGHAQLIDTIRDNLRNGVSYVYFVDPKFPTAAVNYLVDRNDPDRDKMIQGIHLVKVSARLFSTYFTLHFGSGETPWAIFMSSVMQGRKDLLIQVSDQTHMKRVFERIKVLLGSEESTSPRVTSYSL